MTYMGIQESRFVELKQVYRIILNFYLDQFTIFPSRSDHFSLIFQALRHNFSLSQVSLSHLSLNLISLIIQVHTRFMSFLNTTEGEIKNELPKFLLEEFMKQTIFLGLNYQVPSMRVHKTKDSFRIRTELNVIQHTLNQILRCCYSLMDLSAFNIKNKLEIKYPQFTCV